MASASVNISGSGAFEDRIKYVRGYTTAMNDVKAMITKITM